MTPLKAGIITVATGDKMYLSLATDLALSVRRHTDMPITLVLDRRWTGFRDTADAQLFDYIYDLPEASQHNYLAKLHLADLSPYDITLYLDADTLLVGSVHRAVLKIMRSASGYLLQGEYLEPTASKRHHGLDTRKLCRKYGLRRYLKSNSGIMGFRKEPGRAVQKAVRNFADLNPGLHPFKLSTNVPDELLLGVCADNLAIELFEPEQPMYWRMRDIEAFPPANPVVHGIYPNLQSWRWLSAYVTDLRKTAGLPISPGVEAWRRKVLRPEHWPALAWQYLAG